MSEQDGLVDLLARVADHRYTIMAGWLSPIGIIVLPQKVAEAYLVAIIGVFLVLLRVQLYLGP